MSDNAIKIEYLKKQYMLGAIGGKTLNAELQSWWARKRGKEDPNLLIGEGYSDYGKKFYALDGINLEVKKGEALGIIGGNGAGKSTLLKILSRVTAPTSGDVWINGRIAAMLEVGTGFHAELTGRENIYMNGAILGMTKKEVDEKIESIIDFSECRQFIDTPVKRYSSGMYVKLAFAVASHLDAEIMVMDEVLAVGDMAFQTKSLGKMGAEASNGKTVLYVSHNMATIRSLCSRCVVLDHGKLVYDGNVDSAIDMYMGMSEGRIRDYYDFTDSARGGPERTEAVQIHNLKYTSGVKGSLKCGDPLKMDMDVSFYKDVDDLHVLFQVMTADTTKVGLSLSKKLVSGKAGERKTIKAAFDTSMLADGVYAARIWLAEINEYGTRKDFDKPLEDIYFKIVNENPKVMWTYYWGHVQLNDIELL